MDELMDRRLRQRGQLAALGACALKTADLDTLLQEAAQLVAAGMGVRFCKVLEYSPERDDFLLRAGVGWREGIVGQYRLEADGGSPAGLALRTGEPVICNDLTTETRFRTPKLLIEHGIKRAMNVIIRAETTLFGVLEADATHPEPFEEEDTAFMQAAANLLGIAVERRRREERLQVTLQAHELLLREADHRIKNSLQLVASLLNMQRARMDNAEVAAALDSAIMRVRAVAETHRALQHSPDLRQVAFSHILKDLCLHVGELSPDIEVSCTAADPIELDAERGIPLGLILGELLTNAARHAYGPGRTGTVHAEVRAEDGMVVMRVRDQGVGMDPAARPSLGSNIVQALCRQIGATLERVSAPGQGTAITLRLPLAPPEPPAC